MAFVHYTDSITAIQGILKNGLLLNPLKRNVIQLFSDSQHLSAREPQQFGMSSLRYEGFFGNRRHICCFGNYGVVFRKEWVFERQFKQVMYIKENSRFHRELKEFFDDAEKELTERIKQSPPNDAFPYMAYTNKNIASLLGASKYSRFLEIYEIMEPHKNRWQREWRAVQHIPLYNVGSTSEFVKSLSDGGWNNLIMTVKFMPEDVSHFVTTFSNRKHFRDSLPEDYKNKEVCWKIYT